MRTFLITKIFISLVAGTLMFSLVQLLDVGRPELYLGIGASLFIAGVVFVTQFLLDLDHRLLGLEKRDQEGLARTEQTLREGFSKINDATELFGLVEASALRTDAVTQLVRYSTTLDPEAPLLVREFAQAEIQRVTEVLKVLGQGGDLAYEGEDRDWLLELTSKATESIDATSLSTVDAAGDGFIDGGLWISDLGQRYMEAQLDALRRGVRIRRLFILDRPDLAADRGFQSIFEGQKALGIDVRVLDSTEVLRGRHTALSDFIVFDRIVSYETVPATVASLATSRPVVVNTRLVFRAARVQDRIRRFDDLWASGKGLT